MNNFYKINKCLINFNDCLVVQAKIKYTIAIYDLRPAQIVFLKIMLQMLSTATSVEIYFNSIVSPTPTSCTFKAVFILALA